jgi:hypothetical protein
LPDIDHRLHETTEVGCANCNIFFSGTEDRHPITEWNLFVIQENKKCGISDPHEKLYELLYKHHEQEMRADSSRTDIDEYLADNIVPLCPFQIGDRFKFNKYPGGIWSTRSIRAVYGTNTGPFWILTAQTVSKSGRVAEDKHEFWQRDSEFMISIPPYWTPYRWAQIVEGDECLVGRGKGIIINVDPAGRQVSISVGNDTVIVRRLNELRVPLHRVEEDVD